MKMKWYYEKKDLKVTPSVQRGLPFDVEARYRREGARFILDLGAAMKLQTTTGAITMATGVVYFHRFYMAHTFQDFPRYPMACACLFLAGKVEETPKKCKDMVNCAKEILPANKFLQFGTDIRNWVEGIMTLERILLQTIKFDLQLEHPHTFILQYAKCLKGNEARLNKMVQMAWNFVNDSLCTTLCLQWEPEIIAIALMYLAGKLTKFKVVDWVERKTEHLRWWDMFVEDMSIDTLEDICHQVLDFYSKTQLPPPPDSPPQYDVPVSKLPMVASNSANASPIANYGTPKGGSKASTPVQVLTPNMPASASSNVVHPSAAAYAYPPPVQSLPPGMPPYRQAPLPGVHSPFDKTAQPPVNFNVPPPGYAPQQHGYYPPPAGRPYQPPRM